MCTKKKHNIKIIALHVGMYIILLYLYNIYKSIYNIIIQCADYYKICI